jgi:hypothetical protein
MAGTNEHFLRAFGSFTLRDTTNQVTVTARQQGDKPGSVLISWHGYDSTVTDLPPGKSTISQTTDIKTNGWFAFAENSTQIWVFDGVALNSVSFKGKEIIDDGVAGISASDADKYYPKEVRDALPKSFYTK